LRFVLVAFLVAIGLGAPVQAFALTVCKTSDAARVISQIQNQAVDEGTTLDANPMSKATVQSLATAYCGQTQGGDPSADNTQQIEFGCTMLSGIYQSQRVYWTTCPSHAATFTMTNGTPFNIAIAFYSQTRPGYVWPGSGQAYQLVPNATKPFSMSCKFGEQICYGATFPENPMGTYWGVGFNGANGCDNCCITCGGTFGTTLTQSAE
jgi:hypothetical protein